MNWIKLLSSRSWTLKICTCCNEVNADIAILRTRASSPLFTISFCSCTFS